MSVYKICVASVALWIISTATGEEKANTNHLANEKSPYLLQHLHNPVDWYPWGAEAFAKAKKERKPIFLSIGYSTCHWCHVMKEECFEDAEVAKYLNTHFVSIKVDREERPDIDAVYMKAAAYLGSGGGWPLTIAMTPDKKPFFAGTYIPKYSKHNVEGLMTVLPRLYQQFRYNSSFMSTAIARVEQRFRRANAPRPKLPEQVEVRSKLALERMLYTFDSTNGGFGRRSKFPRSHQLLYLLEAYKESHSVELLNAAKFTIDKIRHGGIYDHLGGGIHRYTIDTAWHVPHFEKMLYNQALFAMAVTDLYKITGNKTYHRLAEDKFDYVARDLTSKEGAFFSAENADSEGKEGTFYLWKYSTLKATLSPEELALMTNIFNLKVGGNWVDQAHHKQMPTNILYTSPEGSTLVDSLTATQKIRFESAKKKLFELRKHRIRPSLDDKVLTDWNGLMIAALANAALKLNHDSYRITAEKAYKFIKKNLYKNGQLMHRWRDGDAAIGAMLSDYTSLAWAALTLYKVTHDIDYLQDAITLSKVIIRDFAHNQSGFYMTAKGAETVLSRQFVADDKALPSGNSLAFLVFSELSHFTADHAIGTEADKLQKLLASALPYIPDRRGMTGYVWTTRHAASYEVVLVAHKNGPDVTRFINAINRSGKRVYLHVRTNQNSAKLDKLAPFTKEQKAKDGKVTAYVCKNFTCRAPVQTVKALKELLQ